MRSNRLALMPLGMNKEAYDGGLEFKKELYNQKNEIPAIPKTSVNDDLEFMIDLVLHGMRIEAQLMELFINPMLTPHQLKLIETKDQSFLQWFAKNRSGQSPEVYEDILKNYPDDNPKLRFVGCLCFRQSFYLK